MIIKHLYQRTITHKGKKVKAWYYWYKTGDGKIVRKSCGQNKKPCLVKREAMQYIATLEDSELDKKNVLTFNNFCSGMFDDNSAYIEKLKNRGIETTEKTKIYKRNYLNNYILPKWGNSLISEVDVNNINDWLLELNIGNGTKNCIINTLNEIYKELYNCKLISSIPFIPRFKIDNFSHKDILTEDEIKLLFPDDINELIKVWKIRKHNDSDALMFGTMYYLTLTCGLRSGEIRAIHMEQIKGNALLLNRSINASNIEVDHLKKGNKNNKKWRVTIIPEKTQKLLDVYIKQKDNKDSKYLFELNGTFVDNKQFIRYFHCVLVKNGIDLTNRQLTPHSLRFTCNSMLRHHIPDDILELMIGHTSKVMTDYYDKSDIEMKKQILLMQNNNINDVW